MPAPTLLDYQYWFGLPSDPNGKLFGYGTDVDVVSVEGLESIEMRTGIRELPREDGSVPGLHLASSKTPIFEVEVIGSDEWEDVKSHLSPSRTAEGELHWKWPDQSQKFMRARVLRLTDHQDGLTQNRRPSSVAFEAADPRYYSVAIESIMLGEFNPSGGGIDWEIDWEVDWGSAAGQDVVATNLGKSFAYPVVKFFGPGTGTCTAVLLTNLTTGVELEIITAITSGQVLTADMDARIRGTGGRVIDLDGASRYGDWQLPRDTFYLQPGDNVLRLEVNGTSTDVTASVSWRHTNL